MDKIKFEVCAENINAVKAAIKAGADRVEIQYAGPSLSPAARAVVSR